jgi:SAM-dependent methyltransferase
MSFSNEWDERYQENTHMSIWPWSDLVSLVMQYKPQKEYFKVLELGCGAGANIPLFTKLGVDYYAVEGSETIVKRLHKEYPQYKDNIVSGDFTKDIPNQKFDLIIDRAALTHNDEDSIIECLNKCGNQLAIGGKFIGVDWFSTKYSEYKKGDEGEDVWTRINYREGNFSHVGKVHFSDKDHLLDLFKNFKMLKMFHKVFSEELPNNDWELATWNFVAEKV